MPFETMTRVHGGWAVKHQCADLKACRERREKKDEYLAILAKEELDVCAPVRFRSAMKL